MLLYILNIFHYLYSERKGFQGYWTNAWKREMSTRNAFNRRRFRAPFLEDIVVEWANALPVEAKCDLSLPRGVGEKRIIRQVGKNLSLYYETLPACLCLYRKFTALTMWLNFIAVILTFLWYRLSLCLALHTLLRSKRCSSVLEWRKCRWELMEWRLRLLFYLRK